MKTRSLLISLLFVGLITIANTQSLWPVPYHDSQNSNRANQTTSLPSELSCATFLPNINVGGYQALLSAAYPNVKTFLVYDALMSTDTLRVIKSFLYEYDVFAASNDGQLNFYFYQEGTITEVGALSLENQIMWNYTYEEPMNIIGQSYNTIKNTFELIVYNGQDNITTISHIDVTNGKLLWEVNSATINPIFLANDPATGNLIILNNRSSDYYVSALNEVNGEQIWSTSSLGGNSNGIYPAAVVSDEGVIVLTLSRLVGISAANGNILWTIDQLNAVTNFALLPNSGQDSPVIIYTNFLYSSEGSVSIINPKTGVIVANAPGSLNTYQTVMSVVTVQNHMLISSYNVDKTFLVDLTNEKFGVPLEIIDHSFSNLVVNEDGSFYGYGWYQDNLAQINKDC